MPHYIPIAFLFVLAGMEIPAPPQEAAAYVLVLLLAWIAIVWSLFSRKKIAFYYQVQERDVQIDKQEKALEVVNQLAEHITAIAESQQRMEKVHEVLVDTIEKFVRSERRRKKDSDD